MIFLSLLGLWPPLSHLNRFPYEALAVEQAQRCSDQMARLRWYRYTGGHQRYGHLDPAIAELQERQRYWEALALVHATAGDVGRRQALRDFRALIGPERYLARWKPPLIPDGLPSTVP